MKYSIFILLFLSVSFTALFSQPKNDTANAKQQVMQAEKEVFNAIIAGNTKKLNALFADNYKGYFENEQMDKKYILSTYNDSTTGVTIKDINMDASIYGNTAVVHGIWEFKVRESKSRYFQYTDMFMQQKNTWQEIASQQNPIPVWEARNDLNDSELVPISAISCDTESTLKSLNSDVPAFIRFKNNTAEKLSAYWINYDGTRDTSADQIRSIEAGKFIDVQTFLTHPFVVVGANNKCYGIYEAKSEPSIAIIKD